ncbi:biogenesis of lysosome-related organelles complex 1 subunit 2 [Nematostella vectensis]|uniref:biogenesis of lysosome-related organelles complex 1 subunit 2 n=1 Tax=Nematostella vectensis TaxID=45351 RepID=UPI0020771A3A|nr:biogenesis of lysosome-related organelles complex 1 subunit 2 [Nematostella vectensis]
MADEESSSSSLLSKDLKLPPKTARDTGSVDIKKDEDPFGEISTDARARQRLVSEGSTTAEAEEKDLKETCRVAFDKITQYLNGELTASLEDYTLLEQLNNLTTDKYKEMSTMTKSLITTMEKLDDKYKSLQPYLEQIDRIEDSVSSLEQAAYRLDAYSKKLENKFKRLERR